MCITVKWTWYNGRDNFFHITSGQISTWKGVNQLKELFFLNLIIFFKYIYLKLTNHRYFMIKNPLFFTIHNKNGVLLWNFKYKWPYPDSDQSTGNPLFTMTTSQRACKLVMTTRAFSRRKQHRAKALCWRSGIAKRSWWCLGGAWVSFHPIDVVNLAWSVRFWGFGLNSPLTEHRTSSTNHLFTLHTLLRMLITG